MELDEMVSRTRKTARLIGYFISGMVILFFFLIMAGEFEGTWFDLDNNDDNQETEEMTNGNE